MKHLNMTSAIGANTSDNSFDSSNVVSNRDGSVLERTEYLIQSANPLSDFILIDKDTFDVLDADANNERWNVGYITGSAAASANINSTTSGKLMTKFTTPAAEARYYVNKALPVMNDIWKMTVDLDITWGTMGTTGCAAGIIITKTTTYDSTNYFLFQRAKTSTANQLTFSGKLNNIATTTVTAITLADDALALKVERWGEVWRFYYSTTKSPDENWVLFTEVEDASNYMTNQVGIFLEIYTKAAATSETVQADFDNFQLFAGAGGGSVELTGDYDSTWTTANKDGNAFERLEGVISDIATLSSDIVATTNSDIVTILSNITSFRSDIVATTDSNIVVVQSDIAAIMVRITSDIAAIKSDLVTDIQSDLTVIMSNLLADVQSDITAITGTVKSDISDLRSDMTLALSGITAMRSDIVLVKSDISDIRSSIQVLISDLATATIITIASDLVIIQASEDSDMVVLRADLEGLKSDLRFIDSNLSDVQSDLISAMSDIEMIQSDLSDIQSDVVIVQSDVVIVQSDLKALHNLEGHFATKTITHNGSASYTAFTVTGCVAVKCVGYITTALTNHADSTSVGTATSPAGLIAATAGTAMQTVNSVWVDTAPSKFETMPTGYSIIGNGEDIAVVGTANLSGGVVELYIFWIPLDSTGNVVAT